MGHNTDWAAVRKARKDRADAINVDADENIRRTAVRDDPTGQTSGIRTNLTKPQKRRRLQDQKDDLNRVRDRYYGIIFDTPVTSGQSEYNIVALEVDAEGNQVPMVNLTPQKRTAIRTAFANAGHAITVKQVAEGG